MLIAVVAGLGRGLALLACRSRPSARASAAFRASLPAARAARLLARPRCMAVLPAAISFALLGAIESLLSAVVADGMTGRRHRSNCELVAQGVANIGSALFGGICVTGTIARTATNVRAGAHGPVSGMLHSAVPAGCSCWSPRRSPATSRWPRWPACWRSSPGTWWRSTAFAALLRSSRGDARRAARHLPADRLPRPDRRHRRRLRARRAAVHPPHVEGDRSRSRVRAIPPTPPETTGSPTMRQTPPIRTSSSTASPAPSSSARPRRSPPCSTASPTSAGPSCSTVPRCRSSIRPPPA